MRIPTACRAVVAVLATLTALGAAATDDGSASASSVTECHARPVSDDLLDGAFDEGIGTDDTVIVGADYQRAFTLDDGRVLWVFQDAYVEQNGSRALVHNAGAMQDGACFDVLVGENGTPTSLVAADSTTAWQRWYWPLDGYQRHADTFVLFVAEMEERGGSYLSNATPVATHTVEIDLNTGHAGPLTGAPDSTDALYGFEITADDAYRYLYAQCHRQFGFGWLGHDECAEEVTVARQPLDQPSAPLEYWDGAGWTRNSRNAANIAPTTLPDGAPRGANPMQIERDGDRWIAVTKVGDWWGDSVVFDVAPSPEGPWTTTAVAPVTPDGDLGYSTIEDGASIASYFVSFVPSDDIGHTLAISNNRWDGQFSEWYRPRFQTVPDALWSESPPVALADDGRWWLPEQTAAALARRVSRSGAG